MSNTSVSFVLDQSPMASETGALVFIRGIRSKTSAPQETNLANAQPLIHADKNHAYSILKNVQVPISLFSRYV
jgi:hypothetical protein